MPQAESGSGAGDIDNKKSLGGGNYRLLLLHSEKAKERQVVTALIAIVSISEEQASNCFHTAKQLGMAIVMTCLKEHAELYAVQLYKRGLQARIEPDSATL
jgi:ATP-dependent Clp protease adaptor protein ClpS